MYRIRFSKDYNKSIKKIVKSGKVKIEKVDFVINLIATGKILPPQYHDHKLHGEYEGFRECHIQGDLLLIYRIDKGELVLILIDIGTHSYLF